MGLAVLAVVVQAVVRVGSRALKNSVMRGIAVAAFVAIFFYDAPFPIIIIGTALLGWLVFGHIPDAWTIAGAAVVVLSGLYAWYRDRSDVTSAKP